MKKTLVVILASNENTGQREIWGAEQRESTELEGRVYCFGDPEPNQGNNQMRIAKSTVQITRKETNKTHNATLVLILKINSFFSFLFTQKKLFFFFFFFSSNKKTNSSTKRNKCIDTLSSSLVCRKGRRGEGRGE